MMNKLEELNEEFQGRPLVNEAKYCTYYLVDRFLTETQFLGIEFKQSETGYICVNQVATIEYDPKAMKICSNEEFSEILTELANQITVYRR